MLMGEFRELLNEFANEVVVTLNDYDVFQIVRTEPGFCEIQSTDPYVRCYNCGENISLRLEN